MIMDKKKYIFSEHESRRIIYVGILSECLGHCLSFVSIARVQREAKHMLYRTRYLCKEP